MITAFIAVRLLQLRELVGNKEQAKSVSCERYFDPLEWKIIWSRDRCWTSVNFNGYIFILDSFNITPYALFNTYRSLSSFWLEKTCLLNGQIYTFLNFVVFTFLLYITSKYYLSWGGWSYHYKYHQYKFNTIAFAVRRTLGEVSWTSVINSNSKI